MTKTMCREGCWTDHRLVFSKVNLRITPQGGGKNAPKRPGISKLKQAFCSDICSRLEAVQLSSDDPEENWTTVFRDAARSHKKENATNDDETFAL